MILRLFVCLLNSLEGLRVEAHLAQHGHQTVAACGAEVAAEAYAVDEIEVGVEDVVRRLIAQHTYQQSYDALYYHGVGVGAENYFALRVELGRNPHTALAALYEVCRRFVGFGQRRQLAAKVYDVGIAVHPVVAQIGELGYDFVLNLVDCH